MTDPAPPESAPGEAGGATLIEHDALAAFPVAGQPGQPGVQDQTGDEEDGEDGKKNRSSLRSAIEWILVIGGAVVVALLVKTFLFQAFYIPSPSMSPTLVENDRVLVNKLAYDFHDVRRGDVVVFERPPTEQSENIKDLIKRVIALPGDRVSISGDRLSVNGRLVTESYVHGLPTTYSSCGLGKVQGIDTSTGLRIPKGSVFVMGDNRTDSHDSRCFGPISTKLIVGRAFMIIWPPSKIGTL